MSLKAFILPVLSIVALTASSASAQLLRPKCTPVAPLVCPPGMPLPAMPGTENPSPMDPNAPNPNPPLPGQNDPLQNAFAQGTEGGGNSSRAFNESFNGDFGGIFVTRQVQVGTQSFTVSNTKGSTTTSTTTTVPIYRNVVVPLASRYNGILITDNDSPRPVDRVYFGYNYYNNIGTTLNNGFDRTDMHRQTLGFEKTFLDGNASFGMRLPFIQTTGGYPGIAQSNVGDLSLLLKYAFYNNLNTGDVASAGLVLTTPTGGGNDVILSDGSTPANSVIFQPWLGGVRMLPRGYAQGITSLLVPTDSRDPTLFNNSVSLAYFLYQNANDRFVNALIPFVEAHVRTPLNHSDPDSAIFFQNQMNLTFGTHFRTIRSTLSPAFCVPLVSPKPYSGEFNLMLNIRF